MQKKVNSMDYEYMRALFCRFGLQLKRSQELHTLYNQLREALNQEQRLMLLHLADEETVFCDDYALENFVRGFCLGAGIAEELRNHRYSFWEEEEAKGGHT